MERNDKLKKPSEESITKDAADKATEQAMTELTDEAMEEVSGGLIPRKAKFEKWDKP